MAITASMVKELRERTGLPMMECKKALAAAAGDIDKAIDDLRKASGLKAAKKAGRTAADGIVAAKIADDGSCGVLVEVNSETDFVARDSNFQAFAERVVAKAFSEREQDVATLMHGELEDARETLVQKIGENVSVRRVHLIEAAKVGAYVHSNKRIATIVALSGADVEVAKEVAMHVTAVNPQVVKPEDMPAELLEKEKEIIKAQPDMAGKPEQIVEKMMSGRIKKFLKENSLLEQPFVKNPEVSVGSMVKAAGAEVVSFTRFEVGEGIEKEEMDFAAEVAAQVKSSS